MKGSISNNWEDTETVADGQYGNQLAQQLIPLFQMPPSGDKIRLQVISNYGAKMVITVAKKSTVKQLRQLISQRFHDTFIKEGDDEDANRDHNHHKAKSNNISSINVIDLKYMDFSIPDSEIVEEILEHNASISCVVKPIDKFDKNLTDKLHKIQVDNRIKGENYSNGEKIEGNKKKKKKNKQTNQKQIHNDGQGKQQQQGQVKQQEKVQKKKKKKKVGSNVVNAVSLSQKGRQIKEQKVNVEKTQSSSQSSSDEEQMEIEKDAEEEEVRQEEKKNHQRNNNKAIEMDYRISSSSDSDDAQDNIQNTNNNGPKSNGTVQKENTNSKKMGKAQITKTITQTPQATSATVKVSHPLSSSLPSKTTHTQAIHSDSDSSISSEEEQIKSIDLHAVVSTQQQPKVNIQSVLTSSNKANLLKDQQQDISSYSASSSSSEDDVSSPVMGKHPNKQSNSKNSKQVIQQRQQLVHMDGSSSSDEESDPTLVVDIFAENPRKKQHIERVLPQQQSKKNEINKKGESTQEISTNVSKMNGNTNSTSATGVAPKTAISTSIQLKKNTSFGDDDSLDVDAFQQDSKIAKKPPTKKKRTISFEANVYEEQTSQESSDDDEESSQEIQKKKKKKTTKDTHKDEDKFLSKLAKKFK